MITRRAKWLHFTLLIAIISGSSLGCSLDSYTYQFHGRIRSSADGLPIEGVRIVFREFQGIDALTRADGSFKLSYFADEEEFSGGRLPSWSFVLTKPGYVEEIIDVSPVVVPESTKDVNFMTVIAFMNPVKS